MARVLLLPAVEKDVQEALDWYAERSARAAAGFEQAHRAAILKRYPYIVVFRVINDDALVVAVAHGRRSSAFWQHRD